MVSLANAAIGVLGAAQGLASGLSAQSIHVRNDLSLINFARGSTTVCDCQRPDSRASLQGKFGGKQEGQSSSRRMNRRRRSYFAVRASAGDDNSEVTRDSAGTSASDKQGSEGTTSADSTLSETESAPSSEIGDLAVISEIRSGSKARSRAAALAAAEEQQQKLSLDDVNPVGLGRRSRQLFDDVWRRLTQLGQLAPSPEPALRDQYDSVLAQGPNCDFTIPNAEYTTVLVAGATGRVGRVLLRKLLLRGYTVRALVRATNPETLEKLPRAVQVVEGDLGEPADVQRAIVGCNKVVFCAAARSALSGDLTRVNQLGVYNLAKAMLDNNHRQAQRRAGRSSKSKLTLAKFKKTDSLNAWIVREGSSNNDEIDLRYDGGMDAKLELSENGDGIFSGFVYTKGGFVEVAHPLDLPDGITLDRYEGLVLNVGGDGKGYTLILETSNSNGTSGSSYFYRFNTRTAFSSIRLPFSGFRPMSSDSPPLDAALIHTLAIRFEPRKARPGVLLRSGRGGMDEADGTKDQNSFRLELNFIKALPGGEETDFILVSCTGAGVDEQDREKVLKSKLLGETILRNSGLGYTIVRPGPLQEEPGGQRALVFDQGNRITQGISCADVADVCVKALHDPMARNKSFDVCHEYAAEEGMGLYELVAHLPDKSNNYLTPALAVLEKNT